jgi:hypothetical protein
LELWGKQEDEFLDLNEAEEILRQLRKEDPAEFERIATLRDGIRTARPSPQKGLFVFCQAGRFQQLFLLDDKGAVISRDVPRVVGTVKCSPDVKAADLPDGYNKAVMAVQRDSFMPFGNSGSFLKSRQKKRSKAISTSWKRLSEVL